MQSIFLRNVGWLSPVYTTFISQNIELFRHRCENLKSNVPEGTEENTKISVSTASLRGRDSGHKIPEYKAGREVPVNHVKIK
jgi:regulator of replication initiation timing